MVAIQAVVTQIIFDHALRIKLKSDAQNEPERTKDVDTPDIRSIVGGSETTVAAEETESGYREEAPESSDSRGDGGTETPRSAGASSASVKEDTKQKSGKDKDKDANMIGRINNLITTDLTSLESGQSLFLVGEFVWP